MVRYENEARICSLKVHTFKIFAAALRAAKLLSIFLSSALRTTARPLHFKFVSYAYAGNTGRDSTTFLVIVHCRKVEVDLTQGMPSQLQSGFMQVQRWWPTSFCKGIAMV